MFLWAIFSLFLLFISFPPPQKITTHTSQAAAKLLSWECEQHKYGTRKNVHYQQWVSSYRHLLCTSHLPRKPQNKQGLMLSSISLLLFNKTLFGVSLLACEGWKRWLRSLLSGLLCLQPFRIIFFSAVTHIFSRRLYSPSCIWTDSL